MSMWHRGWYVLDYATAIAADIDRLWRRPAHSRAQRDSDMDTIMDMEQAIEDIVGFFNDANGIGYHGERVTG